ncbi:MAG: hypothetical protein GY799_33055, partial [Desulfobulbaceae bacterium]|nr:hypothetical protein [Desulfobulbaceae bacterium]
FTGQDQGTDDSADSDADTTTGRTETVTLSAGENNLSVDAGMTTRPLAALGDFVWYDADQDGVQGSGESGISGVTVKLINPATGAVLRTSATDGSGYYGFGSLVPGDYAVEFELLSGYSFTGQNLGTDDAADSDADTSTGRTDTVTLSAGESNLTVDAGMYSPTVPASLGDFVWLDTNEDGVQGGGEPGIADVTVNLRDITDELISTTITDSSGYYGFNGLSPDDYVVEFELPEGYAFTSQGQGIDDITDSDADVSTGKTIIVTLVTGEINNTIDAGMVPPEELASLGNYIWLDADKDGIQDDSEIGINGVTVALYRDMDEDGIPEPDTDDGTSLKIMETANDKNGNPGYYDFINLLSGNYFVIFTKPSGYIWTAQDQGTDNLADSDADIDTGIAAVTSLVEKENDISWDGGLYLSDEIASIGNYVWFDSDKNGIQDSGEVGINGVNVSLYRDTDGDGVAEPGTDDGTALETNVTGNDANDNPGYYHFTGLTPGSYFLVFAPPADYILTRQNQGDDEKDSDPEPGTGQTTVTDLIGGENDVTWDAGLYQPDELASLGNYVWLDENRDGIQDFDETGINNVTVTLYKDSDGDGVAEPGQDDGAALETTTTADDAENNAGYYSFTGLVPGNYFVVFTGPTVDYTSTEYILTQKDQGQDDAEDSDADPQTGQTIVTWLDPGENDITWDAGFYILAAIGNYVWFEDDPNGIQDEAGFPFDEMDIFSRSGDYLGPFDDGFPLLPLPPSDSLPRRRDSSKGINGVLATLYMDADNDGIAEPDGDDGAALDSMVTKTDDDGNPGYYKFPVLEPGNYFIVFTPPPEYTITFRDTGDNDAFDSDADPATGQTIVTYLSPGEYDPTWDVAMYISAGLTGLGDRVWYDTDQDGIQDQEESGVAGVTVKLISPADNEVIRTLVTDGSGYYRFIGLVPGDYIVEFVLPDGYEFTGQNQGDNDDVDSNPGVTSGRTETITLTAGKPNLTIDAGIFSPDPPASLGDYVWHDVNGDGIQDTSEPGIANVKVNLRDPDTDDLIATTTTDTSGYYEFTGLSTDDYIVEFKQPPNYNFTGQNQGSNDAGDSDADPNTGRTSTVTLATGESNMSLDAGLLSSFPVASLGDYVWYDTDQDGVQDTEETGVSSVTVNLVNPSSNAVIRTTTTNGSGYYEFTGLVPGSYVVEFELPNNNYEFTGQDQGNDDAGDSDVDTATGKSHTVTLSAGENNLTIDAGIFNPTESPASLGDYVWHDVNGNGVQDTGEPGISNVKVSLRNAVTDEVIAATTTESTGYYEFTGLPPDGYVVDFGLPTGYSFTEQNQGSDDTSDSNADIDTGRSETVTLSAGEINRTIDAGLLTSILSASLGNYVWYDTDQNGIQDASETGINGVDVSLYKDTDGDGIAEPGTDDGDALDTTATTVDASGNSGYYSFTGLAPGSYFVVFTAPDGYIVTMQDTGADDATDSDADPGTGITAVTVLTGGEDDPTWDAGLYASAETASLGN